MIYFLARWLFPTLLFFLIGIGIGLAIKDKSEPTKEYLIASLIAIPTSFAVLALIQTLTISISRLFGYSNPPTWNEYFRIVLTISLIEVANILGNIFAIQGFKTKKE